MFELTLILLFFCRYNNIWSFCLTFSHILNIFLFLHPTFSVLVDCDTPVARWLNAKEQQQALWFLPHWRRGSTSSTRLMKTFPHRLLGNWCRTSHNKEVVKGKRLMMPRLPVRPRTIRHSRAKLLQLSDRKSRDYQGHQGEGPSLTRRPL